eukprot:CAMPEP_0179017862 /NCGR_PEP_ID=MMETSP0796-20121207/4058_1 /TAXON_ID=73915 /ORGANISM="Pyrodinium bahamense, Strain pbaha01" /LENGTH=499 /DNA_ID=CAMNT_0020713605 /DNA_START=84 /DNA_END=1583 /DNA_ORIENTATION=-
MWRLQKLHAEEFGGIRDLCAQEQDPIVDELMSAAAWINNLVAQRSSQRDKVTSPSQGSLKGVPGRWHFPIRKRRAAFIQTWWRARRRRWAERERRSVEECRQAWRLLDGLGRAVAAADRPCTAPMYEAARAGDAEVVRFLCEWGADMERSGMDGGTPLVAAVAAGHVEVIECLCEAHADPGRGAADGITPLHIAAWYGHLKAARLLISAGAATNPFKRGWCLPQHDAEARSRGREIEVRREFWTPAMAAAGNGHLEIVRLLLDCSVDTEPVKSETSLLGLASWHGQISVVRHLCEARADLTLTSTSVWGHQSPLALAARGGHMEVVKHLCGARADVEEGAPLLFAAMAGHPELVHYLCGRGADPNAAHGADGQCPVHAAAWLGHAAALAELCWARADIDRTWRGYGGATPMTAAAFAGHLAAVKYLCNRGADKDRATERGETPLLLAAAEGHLQVVKYLCEARADASKGTPGGATPIVAAAARKHRPVAEYLKSMQPLR